MRHELRDRIQTSPVGQSSGDAIASASVPDVDQWHPRVRELYSHWLAIHPPVGLPGRQHLRPADIPGLLPYIWMLDVHREPFRLKYRLAGTRIVDALKREVTGMWLDDAHPHIRDDEAYLERYRRVALHKEVRWRRGTPVFKQDQHVAELENLILPLATDGECVDILLIITVRYRNDGREYL